MTGRELILYILENHLEDEPVFKDNKLLGYITVTEAAEKMNVGVATILTWLNLGQLKGVTIGNMIYIPARFAVSMEDKLCVVEVQEES